jgi:hypothetical protein
VSLTIDARYCGPPTSANGGYTAGLVARSLLQARGEPLLAGPWVEVTLRAPVPLETPLDVDVTGTEATLRDDGTLVAEARVLPSAPSGGHAVPAVAPERARAVQADYLGLRVHPFPTCWVCGPDSAGGYHLQPGRLDEATTACVWTVGPEAAEDGQVPVEAVWAALDCPGAWTAMVAERVIVLGRQAARVLDVPLLGEDCVVMGERLGGEGRKTFTATTVYGADGRELGRAVATWIDIAPPPGP